MPGFAGHRGWIASQIREKTIEFRGEVEIGLGRFLSLTMC